MGPAMFGNQAKILAVAWQSSCGDGDGMFGRARFKSLEEYLMVAYFILNWTIKSILLTSFLQGVSKLRADLICLLMVDTPT